MISGIQIRCARSALRWSVQELAGRSMVSTSTIKRIEAQDGVPAATDANLAALKSAFENAGITFIGTPEDAPGIRIHRK
jgi:transcriptional regulator with XRE-family HTH domain